MSTYNTGNPIGSSNLKDVYDNSQGLDYAANDLVNDYWIDRFGVNRKTLSGYERRAQSVINSLGWQNPVPYSSGLSVNETTFTVEYDGIVYRPNQIPFVTAEWNPDQWQVLQNDPMLRQDLASATGSEIVGYPGGTVSSKLGESRSILDFGGSSSLSSNSAALNAAAAAGVKRLKFPLSGSGVYTFTGDMNPAASIGMLWDVDPGVTIAVLDVGYLAPDLRVTQPTRVRLTALSDDYWLTPNRHTVPVQSAAYPVGRMAYADADFSRIFPLAPNSTGDLKFKYLPWSGSDVMQPFTPSSVSANGVALGYPAVGAFSMGMRVLRPGDEMTVHASAQIGDTQYLVAMVRSTAGVHGVYSAINAAASPEFFEKLVGAAAATSVISFPPLGTHQSYDGQFALWSIRVNTPTNFSVLLSGLEVLNYDTPGEIIEAGLGSMASASGQQMGLYDWTLTRNKEDSGKRPMSVAIFGDSRTDKNMPDTWPQWMRKMLDGWHGLRVHEIRNFAVSGDVAASQAMHCTAENLAGVDIVVIDVGTNDIQASTNPDAFYNTVKGMVQIAVTAGKRVILGVPDQFYGVGQSEGPGQAAVNYGLGAAIRAKILRLAADTGSKIVDKQQCLGPIMAHYLNPAIPGGISALNLDPIVFDNIHFTAFGQQLIAGAYARAIAGLITKSRREPLSKTPTALDHSVLRNGWTFPADHPKWRRDPSGEISLSGIIAAGVKTSGTVFAVLPENVCPPESGRFPVITDTGVPALLVVDSSGAMLVYYLAESTEWISLDGVSFPSRIS